VSDRLARKQVRQEQHRAALLLAARRQLARSGVSGFSVAAVAAEAGLSKSAFYYYFESQEALVAALSEEALEAEAQALLAAIDAAPTGIAALSALLRCRVRLYAQDFDAFRLLYLWPQVLGMDPAAVARIAYPRSARVQGRLEERLKEEQERGFLHPSVQPRVLAMVPWVTAQGLLSLASGLSSVGGTLRFPLDQVVEEACAALERGARGPDVVTGGA
jgi:AcrR family transcriptional regulator